MLHEFKLVSLVCIAGSPDEVAPGIRRFFEKADLSLSPVAQADSGFDDAGPVKKRLTALLEEFMKKTKSLVLLAFLVGLLAGCQTDTDMTTRKTEMKLEREQKKLDRIGESQVN